MCWIWRVISNRAAIWGFLSLPVKLQRAMARDHGFTAAQVDELVRPLALESGFSKVDVSNVGSTLRMNLQS